MDDQETFACGCHQEPQKGSDYCREHRWFECHNLKNSRSKKCPACFRAHVLSLSLSRKAVPTRRGE